MSEVQQLILDGKRFVVLPADEYEDICREAGRRDVALPALPEPNAEGRVPAIEYSRLSIARDLIRDRSAAGLSQQDLAKLSGVRQETISRIESGKHTVTVRTYDRLLAALEAGKNREKPHRKKTIRAAPGKKTK